MTTTWFMYDINTMTSGEISAITAAMPGMGIYLDVTDTTSMATCHSAGLPVVLQCGSTDGSGNPTLTNGQVITLANAAIATGVNIVAFMLADEPGLVNGTPSGAATWLNSRVGAMRVAGITQRLAITYYDHDSMTAFSAVTDSASVNRFTIVGDLYPGQTGNLNWGSGAHGTWQNYITELMVQARSLGFDFGYTLGDWFTSGFTTPTSAQMDSYIATIVAGDGAGHAPVLVGTYAWPFTMGTSVNNMVIAKTNAAIAAQGGNGVAPTTYYVSNAGSDSNNGLTTGTPFLTIGHAVSVMSGHDTVLSRANDVFNETIVVGASKSGTAGNPTIFGSYGSAGAGRGRWQTNGSSPVLFLNGCSYISFRDLDLSLTNFVAGGGTTVSGEHIVETDSSGTLSATHIDWQRCYLHDSMNCAIQTYLGSTPRSSAGNGTPIGTSQDDADWTMTDCEIYRTGNSGMIFHGSRLTMTRCHVHRWGESSYTPGKHGIYNHSPGSVFDKCWFHNDDAAVNSFSGPQQGSAISSRVTGVMVKDCLIHDTSGPAIFWYDNVRGTSLWLRNRMWNLYLAFYFAAVTDTGPAYNWGPNPVDKFVFANNVMHTLSGVGAMIDLSDATGAKTGGMVLANNTFLGSYSFAVDGNDFSSNNGVTGALLEKNNIWHLDSGSPVFRWNGTTHSLASWQATTVSGTVQGVGSVASNPNLGSAPAGDQRRAPVPYMVGGVVQTPGDNALIGSTGGAPDYFPPGGSAAIDAGTPSVDSSVTYTLV